MHRHVLESNNLASSAQWEIGSVDVIQLQIVNGQMRVARLQPLGDEVDLKRERKMPVNMIDIPLHCFDCSKLF